MMGNAMIVSRVLIAHVLTFPALAFGQALHPDYLDANAGSRQLERLRPKVPTGETATYKERLMGYVQSANADQAPVGTAVRAAPRETSPLLDTIEKGDSITVTKQGDEWSQVVLRRPVDSPTPLNGAEVEPVVLGREKWSQEQSSTQTQTPGGVDVLDPLENEQDPSSKITLPVAPPKPLPAVTLNRPFEGRLVLKTRTFGRQKSFPYQLHNALGKSIAYVDVSGVKAVDPLAFKDCRVTILGTMGPVKEGSDKMVIQARLIRHRN